MTVLRSVVLGCGSYLPARILTNAELARIGQALARDRRDASAPRLVGGTVS